MGYLAASGGSDPATLKRAMAYGTVVASFNVEDFSLNRFLRTERDEIDRRYESYRDHDEPLSNPSMARTTRTFIALAVPGQPGAEADAPADRCLPPTCPARAGRRQFARST